MQRSAGQNRKHPQSAVRAQSRNDRQSESRVLAMGPVLLVRMALFVLSAPFLVTVRNADQASAESADRSVLRVTLDAAARHAAAALTGSHPALDSTPYFDDLGELSVGNRFPADFLATDDPGQVMWDLEAEDVAARVDLSSASPHVLANLIGGAARLTAACTEKDTVFEVSEADGFLPEGVVLVDNEIVGYAELGPSSLGKLARGLLVKTDPDGKPLACGPSVPWGHDVGAYVIDQRAWALCEWRIATSALRAYEGIEQVREAKDFLLGPELGREAYLALERTTSTFGHVRAGARWQHAARLVAEPTGEPQYGCTLPVDDVRWFNPGTTVWITDGTNHELGLVSTTSGNGVVLTGPLHVPFEAGETIVAPLARTPVNVNTAAPEVLRALWTNLKLRGHSARITAGEAEQLVDLALVSRPFTGFEDFLRRLVLPAGGLDELPADAPVRPEALEELARDAKLGANGVKQLVGFIDADDARALYKNALNANDNELEFATMPLCFTAREVYQLALRASVNAPSGIQRAQGQRELTELVVPQRDLLSVWTRQEDFDEAPRLDRAAAGWLTGPVPTSRHDAAYGEVSSLRWPTRTRAHLGPYDSQPSLDPLGGDANVYAFAERDSEDGWAQLAVSREEAQARNASYALHFDDESKELEGRYLPDGTAPLDLAKLGWTGTSASTGGASSSNASLMSGMAFSMWIKPRELEEGARLLDVAGPFTDADRLSLLWEGGNLVLRVLDGAGDQPDSSFKEWSEVLYPLTGEGPGMPRDTWTHVEIAVDGNRPDQMALWVDGRRAARTPGLTRLTGSLQGESDTIAVESTEGFPDKCVLRIGDELIEVFKLDSKTFRARFVSTGVDAGFGGRLAREVFSGDPEVNQGLYKSADHPAGSSVQLYGYSLPVFSNVSSTSSALVDEQGIFAVARVVGVVLNGSERTGSAMEPIKYQGPTDTYDIGHGFDGRGDELDGLVLESTDPGRTIEETMEAFSASGGYAAVLGVRWHDDGQPAFDIDRTRLGGVEVVRYTGYSGSTLLIGERGGAGLKRLQGSGVSSDVAGMGSYIISYATAERPGAEWIAHDTELSYQVMVIPISIPVRGTQGVAGFEQPNGGSAFAQITHSGAESHLTEWVRYDEISSEGFLVRDDPNYLLEANFAAHAGNDGEEDDTPPPPPPNNSFAPALALSSAGPAAAPPAPPVAHTPRPAAQQGGSAYWNYTMGEAEDEDFPVARATNSHFQFRGVLGTYCHAHPAGTLVLPTFRTRNTDETGGRPGRYDAVMFMSPYTNEPGFPAAVHHAHRPSEYLRYSWREDGSNAMVPVADEQDNEPQTGFDVTLTHVALDDRLAVPFAATAMGNANNPVDNRTVSRMALFPSGELPREVATGQLGGNAIASGGARQASAVPSATVDEALFFPNFFYTFAGMPGQLVLASDLGESDSSLTAAKDVVRTIQGDWGQSNNVLANLPENGGLLRIGDELLCYEAYDTGTFTFTLPAAGRGLLGTTPQPHRTGEGISYIGALPLGILGANVTADDAVLPLLELPPGFPSQGLVRIDDELVHYSRVEGGLLEMPRASSEPGEMDQKGPGLFRGRFGTQREAHVAGTPVILFPFRYWDRWSDQADAPEMTYYELSLDQPDAYWKRVFWKTGAPGYPGPELGVLQRTNQETPWDAPPEGDNGLRLLWEGKLDGDGNPIGTQSDRVEWRVFVRHLPGSFDPVDGLAHGWKSTPRLELFGAEYMGPNRTLARIDR